MPSASIGNRKIELALKIYSNLTMSSDTHYLWFRFFDENTNQTVQHVSFFLTMMTQNQLLFRELLHTHTGTLNIKVISTADQEWNVTAAKEPILGGWMPFSNNEPIVAYAPVFNGDNSTYHFNVQMFTIDRDNNIFDTTSPDSTPTFNFYFNMKGQNQTITSPNVPAPELQFVNNGTLRLGSGSPPDTPFYQSYPREDNSWSNLIVFGAIVGVASVTISVYVMRSKK